MDVVANSRMVKVAAAAASPKAFAAGEVSLVQLAASEIQQLPALPEEKNHSTVTEEAAVAGKRSWGCAARTADDTLQIFSRCLATGLSDQAQKHSSETTAVVAAVPSVIWKAMSPSVRWCSAARSSFPVSLSLLVTADLLVARVPSRLGSQPRKAYSYCVSFRAVELAKRYFSLALEYSSDSSVVEFAVAVCNCSLAMGLARLLPVEALKCMSCRLEMAQVRQARLSAHGKV
jgi:hypothetical protein